MLFIFGGAVAGLAVAALIVTVILKLSGSPSAAPESDGKTLGAGIPGLSPAQANPGAAKPDLQGLEKQREFDGLKARLADDPEKLLLLNADLESFVPPPALKLEYDALVSQVEKMIGAARERVFRECMARTEAHRKAGNFQAAAVLWEGMPAIIQGSNLSAKWLEERGRSQRYAEAWALWSKIDKKADEYLAQEDWEIAIEIIRSKENIPESWEEQYEEIWKRREKRISELQAGKELALKTLHDRIQERRKAEEALAREKKRKEREENWIAQLKRTPTVPLISREGGDLENWTHRPLVAGEQGDSAPQVPWSIQTIDGQPTLAASGEGRDVEIGMNGNRWLDWVLEFEVKVESGSLDLKPRVKVQGRGVFSTVATGSTKEFSFSSDDYGSWKRIRVEARLEKVALYEYEGQDKKLKQETEASGDEDQEGGFAFVLAAGGSAKIRNVQLQLVHDSKRPREDAQGEGEGED